MGCAGTRREPLEAARAEHDAVLIGSDGATAAGARVMAPKALAPLEFAKSEGENRPVRDVFGHRAGDSAQIVPIGFFYGREALDRKSRPYREIRHLFDRSCFNVQASKPTVLWLAGK